ncbi:MAG: hypothetical protein ABL995_01370 [Bryobacteraceae bacterium]
MLRAQNPAVASPDDFGICWRAWENKNRDREVFRIKARMLVVSVLFLGLASAAYYLTHSKSLWW